VLVFSAPDERQLNSLFTRVDRVLFRPSDEPALPLPLEGRKLHVHTDWRRDQE
jgi:hypothetical protein